MLQTEMVTQTEMIIVGSGMPGDSSGEESNSSCTVENDLRIVETRKQQEEK